MELKGQCAFRDANPRQPSLPRAKIILRSSKLRGMLWSTVCIYNFYMQFGVDTVLDKRAQNAWPCDWIRIYNVSIKTKPTTF